MPLIYSIGLIVDPKFKFDLKLLMNGYKLFI